MNVNVKENVEIIKKMMEIVNVEDESNFVDYSSDVNLLID